MNRTKEILKNQQSSVNKIINIFNLKLFEQ